MTDDAVTRLVLADDTLIIKSSICRKKLWAVCSAELEPVSMCGITGCNTIVKMM